MTYEESDARQLSTALRDGQVSAKDLLREARRVIEATHDTLNACVALYESADDDAKRADALLRSGKATPLTGIPIALKDNLCVKGQPVTAASKILDGFRSPYDATVVEKLRKNGAVLVCRTNMDEFAMGSSTEHSVYGTTHNPHDTERVAGGSSGGSAALVASGAVPLALGSDTGGSIRQPASFCGVVGLKPTYGSLSRHGLIALGSSLDVIGPFARTVADAEILFNTVRGEDANYDSTVDSFKGEPGKETELVIGVPDTLDEIGVSKETMDAFNGTLEGMRAKGHTTKEVSLVGIEKAGSIYYIIQPAEASSNLARFDGVRYGHSVSGSDLWDGYRKTRSEGFGDEVSRRIVIGTYVLSAGYRDAYYNRAVAARNQLRKVFADALRTVDVIALPTTPDVAFKAGALQDPLMMYAEDRLTLQANLTGMPAISVPMRCEGLPRGIQYLANYGCERSLFACAKDTEALS